MANSADHDQMLFCGIWSVSTLFAQAHLSRYIEDIYYFAVDTINIVIECYENISIFTSAKYEWKFECFITWDEIFMVFTEKE